MVNLEECLHIQTNRTQQFSFRYTRLRDFTLTSTSPDLRIRYFTLFLYCAISDLIPQTKQQQIQAAGPSLTSLLTIITRLLIHHPAGSPN